MNRRLIWLLPCCLLLGEDCRAQFTALSEAERLLLRGNYQECSAAFAELQDQLPVQATLGLSRACLQQGQDDKAIKLLEEQLTHHPMSAQLHAQRAFVALQQGNLNQCRAHLQTALEHDETNIQATWVRAELWRTEGKIDAACDAYRQLAELYDRRSKKIQSPRQLHWLAQAIAQHARFNQDNKRFRQLTTQVYPRLLSLEPNFWPAHFRTGMLLLEKYNAADAESAFNDALQINPQAAAAHVGLARLALDDFKIERAKRHLKRALQIHPTHQAALLCRADLEFGSLQPQAALEQLETLRQLNAHAPEILGRLAAAHQLLTTSQAETHRQANHELIKHAKSSSRNLGQFYFAWAEALDLARRYPQAGERFRQAIETFPALLGPRGRLGMIEMRLGHEDIARPLLEESFQRDPYNVRVKNQLEVLDLLKDYTTLETEHFLIRYDATHDKTLAPILARHAEQCYDELTSAFGYELPEKALLEIFQTGRGVSAQQWFGARMVGLPNIHTIAACGGNIVAMISPTSERRRLNWADILRHEIVHLINIQQTNYAVPHWLTEGCAVWQENRPRKLRWEKLLAKRIPEGNLFDLTTLNAGFLRPKSGEDWQLAYCQAEIYVELIIAKSGQAGIRRLLAAYADNLPTEQALVQALATTPAQIETANLEYLQETSARIASRRDLQKPLKLADAAARWQANPHDLSAGAELALVRLRQGDYPGAGRLAEQLLARQPNLPAARYVKARLLVQIGDGQAAEAVLNSMGEPKSLEPEALKLLASIHLSRQEWDQAKHLYQIGAHRQPDDLQWTKALAVVAIRQQDTAELTRLLTRISHAEPDNLIARQKLLQLAEQDNNLVEIQRWANEVLHINPHNSSAARALKQ